MSNVPSQILQSTELRNPEGPVATSAWRALAGTAVLALASLLTACQTVPESPLEPVDQIATYETPLDLNGCKLARSFVLGDSFEYPGAIEIWECRQKAVVTLNQMLGRWPDRIRQMRSHLTTRMGPDEQLLGCKKDGVYYSGIVAVASYADPLNPQVVRAWKSDVNDWTFEKVAPESVACN